MKQTKRKGFTIVELVIVIAVIAILAAVLIPTFASVIKKANQSADIQAVRQMNTALAVDEVTSNQTIFDVYDALAELGMDAEDYKPLASDTYFFWDSELNRILYTNDKHEVQYPEEYKDAKSGQDGHQWYSLSMNAFDEGSKPTVNYENENNTITATVSTGAEYYYVINEYNNSSNMALDLTISGEIDMMGTECAIKETKGAVTISGSGTIKNICAVTTGMISSNNSTNTDAEYSVGGLIQKAKHDVTIENITVENVNVRTTYAGGVALLIGHAGGNETSDTKNIKINDVTIKNSTVIGHRNVATLIGYIAVSNIEIGDVTYEGDVSVLTIGGRSAKYIGCYNANNSGKITLKVTGDVAGSVSMGIFESKVSDQTFYDKDENVTTITEDVQKITSIKNPDKTEYKEKYAEKLVYNKNAEFQYVEVKNGIDQFGSETWDELKGSNN